MTISRRVGVLAGSAALLLGSACGDLEVTNPNNPDVKRALATPDDVKGLANSSMNTWYFESNTVEPNLMFAVTADVLTANFGNFGMRFNNVEPRIPYNNTTTGADFATAEDPWYGMYSALGAANDALRAVKSGVTMGSEDATSRVVAIGSFVQAASLTNLALNFDQAFVLDEDSDPAVKQELQPYKDVTAATQAKWDALISFLNGKSLTWDGDEANVINGMSLTSAKLQKMSNTMAARLLAYSARTKAETGTANWAKILTYANNGISTGSAFDFTVVGDGQNWYSDYLTYADLRSWLSIDMKVINKLDPTQPSKFTGVLPPRATSLDARLESDFSYRGSVLGQAARGVYMQSPWWHTRYDYHSFDSETPGVGPAPYVLAAENDLLIAEALIRTGGSAATAATLINKTRVGRGQLAPLTGGEGTDALIAAIMYERDIELMNTAGGLPLYDHRRVDDLQAGTLRHLPVPAKELEVLQLPLYSFGGVGPNDKVLSLQLPGGAMMQLVQPAPPPRPRRGTPK